MKKRGLSLHIILRPFLFLLFCGLFPLHLSAQHTESVIGKDNVGRLIEPSQPIEHIFLNVDPSFVGTLNQQYTPSTGDTLSYNITYNDLHIIKDHLDSPRKIFTNLTVRERNYYYPFGLRTDQGRAYPTLSDRYMVKVPRLTQSTGGTTTKIGYRATVPYTLQYNGKELQQLANTTLIDYGARQYNPTLARWTTQDPMAEKYYGLSPYAYCAGNPVMFVDMEGNVIIVPDWRKVWTRTTGALQMVGGVAQVAAGGGFAITTSPTIVGAAGVEMSTIFIGGNAGALRFAKNSKAVSESLKSYSKIGSTGKFGEDALKKLVGGEYQYKFNTPKGKRIVDQFSNSISHEAKVGYQSLNKSIKTQISKDVTLLTEGRVKGVTWHFFRSPVTGKIGPSQPLFNELKENGFNIIIHD